MEQDGQVVVASLIIICLTLIAIAATVAGVVLQDSMIITAGVDGTIVGGLLAALQTPGSLTKTVQSFFGKKDPPQ